MFLSEIIYKYELKTDNNLMLGKNGRGTVNAVLISEHCIFH